MEVVVVGFLFVFNDNGVDVVIGVFVNFVGIVKFGVDSKFGYRGVGFLWMDG